MRRLDRESGIVLLAVFMVGLVLFATSTVALTFSVTEADMMNRRFDELAAFYLAEGALETAKYEIAQNIDTDTGPPGQRDGIGVASGTKSFGTFEVTSTDLGDGHYQLDATGVGNDGSIIYLTTTVAKGTMKTTRFPPGGMSMVGDLDSANISLDLDSDFILSGGDGAALTLSQQATYDWFGDQLAGAIDSGNLPAVNLTGGVTNTFNYAGTDYDLPLEMEPDYDARLTALENTYLDLRAKADELRIGADIAVSGDADDDDEVSFNGTIGSPTSPVTLQVPNDLNLSNRTITGYGTLIVADHLTLNNTTLDWHGDIFVKGDGIIGFMVAHNNSVINVTGNLVNLGEASWLTYIGAWGGSQWNVDGNFFIGSNWTDSSWARGYLDVAGGSTVSVDGVLTMIGRKSGIDTDGNAANELLVNGMFQAAVPDTSSTSLNLDFDGVVEIYRDTTLIESAMSALHDLGIEHDIVTSIEDVVTDLGLGETKAWQKGKSGSAGAGGKHGNGKGNGKGNS